MNSKEKKPEWFAILCLINWLLELECDPKGRDVGFIVCVALVPKL